MAIVHEWVSSCGGAEKVFARFAGLWPDADLYALTVDPDQTFIPTSRPIRTSGLDNRWGRSHRAMTLPLMARAWRQMMSGSVYDKVLVSHHALATSALRHVKARHTFAYVHTPARYFWNPEVDTRGAGIATAPVRHLFCRFDRRNAASVEAIAVNSHAVAQRVRTHWGRTAQVIAPPVDVDFFHPGEETRQGFILGASRFVPYKRLDLVIAAGEATRMPVVLAGAGPAETELRKLADAASVPVSFVIQPSAEQLRSLYRQASVFVFLALEDFGIMPVEAQACGTPVVALAAGGSLDTVSHGESGILVSDTSAPALDEAVNKAAGLSPQACRRHACRFAPDVFDQAIRDWVS